MGSKEKEIMKKTIMNKQKKQFAGLIVVLIVLVIAYFALTKINENEQNNSETEENIEVLTVDTSQVESLSFIIDGENYLFHKDSDSNWICENDTTAYIDEDAINSLISALESVTAKEEVEDTTYEDDFGFDSPGNVITVGTSGENHTLTIGNYNELLSEYYLKVDGEKVYLIDSSLVTAFNQSYENLLAEETDTEETDTEETNEKAGTEEVSTEQ